LGSDGQYGWTGAASTYYTIDPKEKLVAMLFLQHIPRDDGGHDLPRISRNFYNLVYQAIP
jgi:CubicO group peptidase (beta-lactamase class C family)